MHHHHPARRIAILLPLFLSIITALIPSAPAQSPIAAVMDDLVTRLLDASPQADSGALTEPAILQMLTPEQHRILASEYWSFTVNVPVSVSVMRDTAQKQPPFWLAETGFQKTTLKARNENYRYEVWQKEFPAGKVGLGINGFDCHRPHYFVSVGPLNPNDTLQIADTVPANQQCFEMREGAFVYHDWPDLLLTSVPESLVGQTLLTTIRGRAREAHLIEAFRKTAHPSSPAPGLITLTWSEDPQRTQTIQWRAAESVAQGIVRCRPANAAPDAPWTETSAERTLMDDRNIINDRRISHFTATLRGLEPATEYTYSVGGAPGDPISAESRFRTAPATPEPFTFLWMSDTHNQESNAPLLQTAWQKHPEAAFLAISGDLVGIGQYRDDWDRALANDADFIRQRPFMPSIGNHDAIDGLGSEIYRTLFRLPANGPSNLDPGKSYAFTYSNTLFISLDITEEIAPQTPWLEKTLLDSNATWKIAIFHFPPYAPGEENPEIVQHWCPLFDKYNVDLVLGGHVHYYLRTQPIRDGKPVTPPERGTTYLVSFAVPSGGEFARKAPYAAKMGLDGAPLCQAFTINQNQLHYQAYDPQGNTYDQMTIDKPADTP